MTIADTVMNILVGPGRNADLGEPVLQAEHTLQAAWIAERDGACETLAVPGPEHCRARMEAQAQAAPRARGGD
jgi:predicted HD phosphohydrolase